MGCFQSAVLHSPQHLRVRQHHAAAAQLLLQGSLELFRLDAPVLFQDHLPGRVIQYPRRHNGIAEIAAALLLQSEQVQEHLNAQAVPQVRQVKGFFPGFVVHHPQIQLSVVEPAVHPVHLAADGQGLISLGDGNGGQLPVPAAEAQLEGHR